MGLLDNIGDQVAKHEEAITAAVDKTGDFIDEKTGGKFAEKIDSAQDAIKNKVEELGNR